MQLCMWNLKWQTWSERIQRRKLYQVSKIVFVIIFDKQNEFRFKLYFFNRVHKNVSPRSANIQRRRNKRKLRTKNSKDKRNKDEAMIKENSFESIFIIGGMARKEFKRFIRGSICQCRWFSSLKVRACDVANKAGCDIKLGTFEHVFYRPPYSPSAVTSSARIPRWIFTSGPRGGRFKGRASALYPISSTLFSVVLPREESSLCHLLLSFEPSTRRLTLLSLFHPPLCLFRLFCFASVFHFFFLLPLPLFLLLSLLFRFLCWGGVGIFFTFYQSFYLLLFFSSILFLYLA